ncbi:MAG: hypothetical protein M3R38_03965 [Actinomycetota bacterium]|nr:hypothetical protein [Actinomycetota bacterium]
MGKKHRAKKNNAGRRRADRLGGGPSHVPAGSGRRAAATHEAAHAVARQVLLGNVVEARVNDKGGGRVDGPEVPYKALSRAELEATAVITYAGVYAERRLVPKHAAAKVVVQTDLDQVAFIKMVGRFTALEMASFYRRAGRLVVHHKVEVEAVAARLHLCGRLRGATVFEIVAAARAVPPANEGRAA